MNENLITRLRAISTDPRATADMRAAADEIERLWKIEKAARKLVARLDRTEMSFPVYKELAELLP